MKTLFLCLFLVGCSSIQGVEITEHERKVCEIEPCTVWTLRELTNIAKKFFFEGYKAGVKSI